MTLMGQILPAFNPAATPDGQQNPLSRCDCIHVFNAEPAKPAEQDFTAKHAKIATH